MANSAQFSNPGFHTLEPLLVDSQTGGSGFSVNHIMKFLDYTDPVSDLEMHVPLGIASVAKEYVKLPYNPVHPKDDYIVGDKLFSSLLDMASSDTDYRGKGGKGSKGNKESKGGKTGKGTNGNKETRKTRAVKSHTRETRRRR